MTDQTEDTDDKAEVEAVDVQEPETTEQVEAEASDDTVVTFGTDEPPESKEMPSWVKDLRKRNRELNKANSELEKQVKAGKAEDTTALGAGPTLEACDYDADKYRDSLREWDRDKAKIDAKAKDAQNEHEGQQKAYDVRLTEYQDGRADFDADSFDEAEGAVKDALSDTQQTILIRAFGSKAAPLISGLGRDDKRLKELASISDPVAFTVAATRLEAAMKVSQRKPRTVPETIVKGNSSVSMGGDKTLQKLRDEAANTGDMSKVVAYKRKLKAG